MRSDEWNPQTSQPLLAVDIESVVASITAQSFPAVDAVIGIERGGLVPAAIIAGKLATAMGTVRVRYRNDQNDIALEAPQVLQGPSISPRLGAHVLLVDDVSVTGATFRAAREVLGDVQVTTVSLLGSADIVLLPQIDGCVLWPWNVASNPAGMLPASVDPQPTL